MLYIRSESQEDIKDEDTKESHYNYKLTPIGRDGVAQTINNRALIADISITLDLGINNIGINNEKDEDVERKRYQIRKPIGEEKENIENTLNDLCMMMNIL
ncbi:hypothetical protein JCM16358_20500 [Halanaerocella petrolearia]